MRTWKHASAAVAALSLVTLGMGVALAGAKGKPTAAKAALVMPFGGPDVDAKGVVDWKHFPVVGKRAERSWLRLRLNRLDGTAYTLWMDDPSTPETDLVQAATLTASAPGRHGYGLNFRLDTKHGDALPFNAALADLVGKAIEVRDVAGAAVLDGTVPAVPVKTPHGHGHH